MLKVYSLGTSLVVQWVRLCAPNAGGAGVQSLVKELDPTCMPQLRVHMWQLRVHMPQLRNPHAATKKSTYHNENTACHN